MGGDATGIEAGVAATMVESRMDRRMMVRITNRFHNTNKNLMVSQDSYENVRAY